MLPELIGSGQLIGDLQLAAPVFSPNGDGINDQLEVRFVALKAQDTEIKVEVFDLAGRKIAALIQSSHGSQQLFTWDGRDANGATAEPGVYLLRIDLGAEAGDDTALRSIAVAY
jgi:flagellar hook assembly protein FlgD